MLNIEATFNGEDFEEVQVDSQSWTYSGLKTTLKSQFLLSSDEDIEIYDSENKEFSSASLISWRSKKFRVALLNKRYVPEAYLKGSNNSVSEDTKELESGLTDEISKHKYSCCSKGCRKTFKAPAKLFNHIKIHFKNKPFQWEVKDCGKMFLCKGQLRNHMSTHTEQRRFHCKHPGCDSSYSKKSRLVVHERSHTGERPFVCPYEGCGKSFAEKGNLKTHVRTHTGEKPYFCSVKGCNKRFTTQGHLVDHERRHKDEKPYEWEVCGKAFMRSSTVKVHMKTHGKNLISVPMPESDQLEEAKAIIQEAKKNSPIFVKPIRPIVSSNFFPSFLLNYEIRLASVQTYRVSWKHQKARPNHA